MEHDQHPADAVSVEVDGPEAQPDNVPTTSLLRIASAYFAAIEKYASKVLGSDLELHGIEIVDKCTQVRATTGRPDLAHEAVRAALDIASGQMVPPHGTKGEFDALWDAYEALGDLTVRLRSGGDIASRLSLREGYRPAISGELGTWRARVLNVGGVDPTVKFRVDGLGTFSLRAEEAIVVELANHLYKPVELVAEIERDAKGRVTGGTLISFEPVFMGTVAERIAHLRSWFIEGESDLLRAGGLEALHASEPNEVLTYDH